MVSDGGSQILKLAAGGGDMAPRLHIFVAGLLVEVAEGLVRKMIEDAAKPRRSLCRSGMPRGNILGVDRARPAWCRGILGSGITLAT
jgi:hypothetical protein